MGQFQKSPRIHNNSLLKIYKNNLNSKFHWLKQILTIILPAKLLQISQKQRIQSIVSSSNQFHEMDKSIPAKFPIKENGKSLTFISVVLIIEILFMFEMKMTEFLLSKLHKTKLISSILSFLFSLSYS